METTEIKTTFKDKEVTYNTKTEKWAYDGVQEDIVRKLNPELAQQVASVLTKEVKEYQDRIKKEEAEQKAKEFEAKKQQLEQFKAEVTPLIPEGFETRFIELKSDSFYFHDVQGFTIKKGNVDATIRFDDRVSGQGYYSKKTELVWERSFDYKHQRFATLEKAIKNACTKIDEKLEQYKQEQQILDKQNEKRKGLAKQLKEFGIDLVVDAKWHHGYRGHGYEEKTERAKIDIRKDITVKGDIGHSPSGKIEIGRITITGEYTIEQFNQVARLIREITQ